MHPILIKHANREHAKRLSDNLISNAMRQSESTDDHDFQAYCSDYVTAVTYAHKKAMARSKSGLLNKNDAWHGLEQRMGDRLGFQDGLEAFEAVLKIIEGGKIQRRHCYQPNIKKPHKMDWSSTKDTMPMEDEMQHRLNRDYDGDNYNQCSEYFYNGDKASAFKERDRMNY